MSRTTPRLLLLAVLAGVTFLGLGPASHRPELSVGETPSSFVGRDGTSLTRDGHPFRFTGMNVYDAAGTGSCGDLGATGGLDAALAAIADGSGGSANVIRVWFFQPMATRGGQRDWTALDDAVRTARARGFLLIPALGNHWSDCDGDRTPRPEQWFAGDYRSVEPGNSASYRSWVAEVVTRYRHDPTVAFWQLMNEAEISPPGDCPPTAAATLRAFVSDVSALVKSIDHNHLLSVGTVGNGQCGVSAGEYGLLHALDDVDLCEYHDYGADVQPMPGDQWNGLQRRLSQCFGLGKPLFVGESGMSAQLGLERRADLFRSKITAQFAAGVAGYLPWAWSNRGASHDDFAIGPGDPLLSVLGQSAADGASRRLSTPPGPPMGFNPYNAFGNGVTENTIREVADAVVRTGMQDAGYSYINLDDSWQGPRDPTGTLTANADFPSGIAALADYVHARGLLLGIYTTPAARSCGGRPGSAGHTERDAQTFADWGVDFVKLDWCGADYSPAGAQRIAERWRDAIAATGRPMVLSVNAGSDGSVPSWASRTTTMWRTGDDICASWFNKSRPPSPAARDCWTRAQHNGIFDYIESSTESHQPYVGPGRWADPDMLEVGNPGLTHEEARTHFGLWAMWSAPLLAGHDPRAMTEGDATSQILLDREVIAIDQDPLASVARTVQQSSSERVWLKPLSGGRYAVLAVNLEDSPRAITVDWSAIGIHDPFIVRDVWAHADRGDIDVVFRTAWLPPHASALLLLTPTT